MTITQFIKRGLLVEGAIILLCGSVLCYRQIYPPPPAASKLPANKIKAPKLIVVTKNGKWVDGYLACDGDISVTSTGVKIEHTDGEITEIEGDKVRIVAVRPEVCQDWKENQ